MLEIILFVFLGLAFGIIFGLIPGLHPNMIILLVPIFSALPLPTEYILVFVVSLAVSNSIVDMIPSILFGAPDAGNELAILPGHQMLLEGNGYQAIKLTVIGSLGSIIFLIAVTPLLILIIPDVFAFLRPYTHVLLVFIATIMILSEPGNRKLVAFFAFLVSGIIGIASGRLPIDSSFILFPILSGLFGVSVLFLQIKSKIQLPEQNTNQSPISSKLAKRSVISGSLGGLFSGLLPGVGSSEIASLVSIDKNKKSFLISLGALTTSNIIVSLLSLWLIGRSRSGAAVVLNQLMTVGFGEFLLIIASGLAVTGLASVVTLVLAKFMVKRIRRVNYSLISLTIIVFIVVLTVVFTGLFGLLLLVSCTSLGVFTIVSKIRRSSLMGVLMIPTILFFAL